MVVRLKSSDNGKSIILTCFFRIVNGYEPEIRPWMALIEIRSRGTSKTDVGQCGGAILNKVTKNKFHNI